MNKMDLQQTDNKPLDILLFFIASVVVSEIWKEIISLSIHAIGSVITILLGCFVGYMAKNFWCPYLFPKEGKWKVFNFLRPNKK